MNLCTKETAAEIRRKYNASKNKNNIIDGYTYSKLRWDVENLFFYVFPEFYPSKINRYTVYVHTDVCA